MICYIPARGGSRRVAKKNIRPLAGKPVLGHVIEHIRQLDFIDHIFVSTDDPAIQEVAASFGAATLALRAPALADDRSGFIDLIRADVPRYCTASGDDREILFVLATAALVPPAIFREAHAAYVQHKPELLMSCTSYPVTPFFAMTQKKDGYWQALFPDKVLLNTQDLPPTLVDAGLFYYFSQAAVAGYPDIKLVEKLYAYRVEDRYAVDVDTFEDWQSLEEKYRRLHEHAGG
jgi:CMP-N-acetylneuraminic acid synthetase